MVRATLPTTTVLLLLASLPGPLFLICVTSYHQLSTFDDSVNYISFANSLKEGALIGFTGSPDVLWPPMLSWLLFLFSFSGISAIRAAAIINASSWFGAAFISGNWVRAVIGSPVLACAVALWVSISAPLLSVALYVMSEALFSFFLVFSLWALHRYLPGRDWRALLIAGLSCGSAMLTRYVGAVLFGVELLVLSLFALVQRRLWFLESVP
jgi:4-amino-4-deoxy-L-arabinose transferase-like glycosyltransferase